MYDLCYVISFGFAARMLLQTGLIERLTEQGKTVAIITPDPNDPNLRELDSNPRVAVFALREKYKLWDEDYLFKRKYYLEDIKANPALWEKHVHGLWYSRSRHPWRRIRPLYYYLIHRLIPYFPIIRQRFVAQEKSYLASAEAAALLDKIQPALLVSTYPVNFLEAKLLHAAKEKSIPTLLHLLSWDNITSKGKFPVIADYFIVWGAIMYEELQSYYGIPAAHIYTCGVPHFDNHIERQQNPQYREQLRTMGLDPAAPFLFFAMSAQRFAPREIDIVERLAREIEAGTYGADLQLVVRPHPQNLQGHMASESWLGRLKALPSQRVAVDFPRMHSSALKWSIQKEDMNHLSDLLVGCSICLNSGATISIEALLVDKPVLLTSFDADAQLSYWKSARRLVDYTHLRKFVDLGGATIVHSYAEMDRAIRHYLAHPEADREKRQRARFRECYRDDGHATERVVAAVDDLLVQLTTKV